jgi:hypothetical protein
MASEKYGHPNIIHANVNNTADVAVVLGRLTRVPVVLSEHSSDYARKRFSPSQVRKLRFFMNRVNLILPVSNALGQAMRGYGISRPMLNIPNVADPDVFYLASPGEQVSSPYREITLIPVERGKSGAPGYLLPFYNNGASTTSFRSLVMDQKELTWRHW